MAILFPTNFIKLGRWSFSSISSCHLSQKWQYCFHYRGWLKQPSTLIAQVQIQETDRSRPSRRLTLATSAWSIVSELDRSPSCLWQKHSSFSEDENPDLLQWARVLECATGNLSISEWYSILRPRRTLSSFHLRFPCLGFFRRLI